MAKLPTTCTAGRWENTATDAKFRLTGPKMIRIICNVFFTHSEVLYVFQGTEELEEGTMN